ncbi:thiol reductant ABC exporter subunit CydC [Paenibacillus donghaensis]|uniref:thiol reductant ABC exporter subunit CydC n=1 Tax=Paenibacillus donghaensis TaxID=414771 RepID=UPI001883B63D|nr:thiol reductant ABC exporter subunit CydC [Paenibacillus donghaensis]MBE9916836.1 thiol reductant ABC exporter subunit CydC [Paenibacillus donghaensis]
MREESWLRPYVRTYWGRFLIIIALGCLTLLTASMLMFTSGFLISKAALRPENILMVYVPIVLVRTFGISRAVVHYVERLVSHDAVLRIVSLMRTRLYRILEPQALFISSRFRTGDMLGVLSDDIQYLQDVYLRTVFPSIVALVMYIASIAALGWFDIRFALFMALYIFILVAVLPWVSLLITKAKSRLAKQQRSNLYTKLTDAVLGMSDWVISGRQSAFLAAYEAEEREAARVNSQLKSWARWRQLIGQTVVGLSVVSMVVWAAREYAGGHIAPTLIAAFALVMFPLMDAFMPVSDAIEKIPNYQSSLQRLSEIGRIPGGGNSHDTAGQTGMKEDSYISAEDVRRLAGSDVHLTVQNVSYRYDDASPWSLENVSLDLPQGKRIAIIGRSGAGKSTLLKLIEGALAPSKGTVSLNGTEAYAIGEQMPQVVSVLNQSPHLFDTTVENNIRLGDRSAEDEDVRRAAAQVKLDRLIASLPLGYKTPMHETGQRFSGGERQRIALARVLLQNNPVVILDEPTVGLDPLTENDLIATILETMKGKSLVWVTHHLVGAEQMDEIIFMENGRVEMRGSHAELLATSERYRNLYRLDRPEAFMVK